MRGAGAIERGRFVTREHRFVARVRRADGSTAAPSWVRAVRRAREAGVHVVAFGCEVGASRLRLGPALPVRSGHPPARPPRARAQATSTTTAAT